MCLAVPVRVTEVLPDAMARVNLDGVAMTVSVAFLDDVAPGDYVVLHVGHAIAKIDPDEAEETLRLIREAAGLAP
jgi:hydrogenase expression/formation protein HypC